MVDMPVGHRSYGQACPVAHALDVIGERWALLVIRELRLGPRRYADLQAALPAISPSVLAQRLHDLERAEVVCKRALRAPIRAQLYGLSPWGADLEPVFVALASWGSRSPHAPLTGELSDDTVMLGLRTFFRAGPPQRNATFRSTSSTRPITCGCAAAASSRWPAPSPPTRSTPSSLPAASAVQLSMTIRGFLTRGGAPLGDHFGGSSRLSVIRMVHRELIMPLSRRC